MQPEQLHTRARLITGILEEVSSSYSTAMHALATMQTAGLNDVVGISRTFSLNEKDEIAPWCQHMAVLVNRGDFTADFSFGAVPLQWKAAAGLAFAEAYDQRVIDLVAKSEGSWMLCRDASDDRDWAPLCTVHCLRDFLVVDVGEDLTDESDLSAALQDYQVLVTGSLSNHALIMALQAAATFIRGRLIRCSFSLSETRIRAIREAHISVSPPAA